MNWWWVFCPRRGCTYREKFTGLFVEARLRRACPSCHKFGVDAVPVSSERPT